MKGPDSFDGSFDYRIWNGSKQCDGMQPDSEKILQDSLRFSQILDGCEA